MDFDLVKHTILLTKAGSRAYGMHTKDSDLDVKGVAIAPKSYYLGCMRHFEQADGKENIALFKSILAESEVANGLEGTVYELKKFLALVTECNPNNLDALFCRDEDVVLETKLGKLLRENRNFFISGRARWSYAGYAHAQLKRINLHRRYFTNPPTHEPTRAEFELPDAIPKHKYDAAVDAIQKKLDSWEMDLSGISASDRIDIQSQFANKLAEIQLTADQKWQCAGRAIGYDENLLSLLEGERKFRRAQVEWKQYLDWKKNRNPERAAMEEKFGLDLKHATHLIRLMRMCKEILTTGQVRVWRGDIDAEDLLAIRAGSMTYEQIVEYSEKLEAECDEIYKSGKYAVPKKPDTIVIDRLCEQMIEASFQAA